MTNDDRYPIRVAEVVKPLEAHEPTIAPGVDTQGALEEEPTRREKETGDTTQVTRLYLDRAPEK